MTELAAWLAVGLSLLVLMHTAPWLFLCLLAVRSPSGNVAAAPMRLAVIVPAHDEEAGIGATVASLRAAPFDPQPEIIVVADNCTDATADAARRAGATVLERRDPARRGKSFALDYGVHAVRQRDHHPDAIIVVDADSTVSTNFFRAISGRLAAGDEAIQVAYDPAPSPASVARLRKVGFALVHRARPLGASRLGLGTGIKGNGFALAWRLVREGLPGHGLAEDASLTLALARRGVAVRFEPRATIWGEMAPTYAAASTQDRRWERGRLALVPRALAIAVRAAAAGRITAAGGALEVAALPLSLLTMASLAALALAAGSREPLPAALTVASVASIPGYVALGALAARLPPRDLLVLAHAPRFLAHKATVYAQLAAGRGPRAWERTRRDVSESDRRGAS